MATKFAKVFFCDRSLLASLANFILVTSVLVWPSHKVIKYFWCRVRFAPLAGCSRSNWGQLVIFYVCPLHYFREHSFNLYCVLL